MSVLVAATKGKTLKRFNFLIVLLIVLLPAHGSSMPSTGNVEVFFSPNGGATEAVVKEIGKARSEVLV